MHITNLLFTVASLAISTCAAQPIVDNCTTVPSSTGNIWIMEISSVGTANSTICDKAVSNIEFDFAAFNTSIVGTPNCAVTAAEQMVLNFQSATGAASANQQRRALNCAIITTFGVAEVLFNSSLCDVSVF